MDSQLIYRQLTACIFLAAFLFQTFSRTLIVVGYYADTNAYAKNCENKARPQMHCNGKCQMMKKLKEEEKQDQQNPERKSDNKNEVVLSSKSFAPKLPSICIASLNGKSYLNSPDNKIADRAFDIFHPPRA